MRYRKIAGLTVGAVVFLILVGGIVRMTGSGMGCPDWPKCFGNWVPPTNVAQLPENYQEIYSDRGYADTEFNVFNTWTEYINRLIGVLIGLFAILTAVASLPLARYNRRVTVFSFLGLGMVIVQGGLGAYVVRTNLHTGIISLHMIMALLILACYLCAFLSAQKDRILWKVEDLPIIPPSTMVFGGLALVLVLMQIVMGTQVREAIDSIAKEMGNESRALWIDQLGGVYAVHKFFYYIVVMAIAFWAWQIRKTLAARAWMKQLMIGVFCAIGVEILLGLGMHHFGIPKLFQPLHLLFATLLFGLLFSLWGAIWMQRQAIVKHARLSVALN